MNIKTLWVTIVTLCLCLTTAEAEVAGVEVIHECDTTWRFGYSGIYVYARNMHRIDIAYPSVDAKGNAVRLSGSIIIPSNIYDDGDPVDGVVLYNRYTQTEPRCVPTRGFAESESAILASPLKPNWILVESDFYGFGVSSEHLIDQYYVYGDANGYASIDCLLAARQVLDERHISQGKFLFNVGLSSGGYDALATQRVRDMYYRDKVFFDKTMVGEAPFDVNITYSHCLQHQDDDTRLSSFVPLVLESFNRNDSLGFTYQQMFTEPLASKFQEWFYSGKYSKKAARDSIKKSGNRLSQVLSPALLDSSTVEYHKLREAFERRSLTKGWTPDRSQRYFYMHYTRDKAVPIDAGRALLTFLTGKGFEKSLIPEKTNLQTCMYIPSDSHGLCGAHFLLKVSAMLAAYPVLYYDGELNTYYYDIIKDLTPMGIVKKLENEGYDLSSMLDNLTGGRLPERVNVITLALALTTLNEPLLEWGTNVKELTQIASDSGLELSDMVTIINYLQSKNR